MRTRILVLTFVVGLASIAAVPAAAKGGKPKPPAEATIWLVLDCHWEPSADIPFAHLDATVEWSGIGKSRHTLGIEVEDADDPDWLAGHGHDLFRQPAGTYSHHMDLGFSASGNYRGVAYLTSVAVGPDGSVWFGTTAEGSARFLPGS